MEKEGACRGGGSVAAHQPAQPSPAQLLHTSTTTVLKALASLPRLILASRTPFASFLAQSFHIHRCGITPASVVFPLPLADFGLFASSGPKLSKRRWRTLVRKRAMHVIIVALNYLHGGLSFSQLHLLGRRPNPVQQRAHQRLWALLTTCDSPGEGGAIPLSPGRSGAEFIARLQELEHFASSQQLLAEESYGGGPIDFELQKVGSAFPDESNLPVQPYSALNSDRLRLVGQGRWELARFLEDELWLPFQEPKILQHIFPIDRSLGPNLKKEKRSENLKLAKKWGDLGLLALVRNPPHQDAFCRIFNAFKNEDCDRQIGDRRLANATERHLPGPSKNLPIGFMMTGIYVARGCIVRGSITDRKDFYHQAKVTRERAATNVLPFEFCERDFLGSDALEELRTVESLRGGRESRGDRLGFCPRSVLAPRDEGVYPAFKSLLQGDHLGVEFALSAHATILKEAGLLADGSRILGNHPFPLGPVYEGLVIDDYYVLSCERSSVCLEESPSVAAFDRAIQHYAKLEVLGSPEKDIRGSVHFKVAGAEINSSEAARSKGLVTVSAPVQKRVSLALLSLRVASLPVISSALASRLAGNWTSVLLYRRCLTCILSHLYKFCSAHEGSPEDVFSLPRAAAEEPVLASVLSFVAASDVSTPYHSSVFATDASLSKGAVVSRPVAPEVAKVLWLGGDRRGSSTVLDPPFREASRICGLHDGEEPDPPNTFSDGPHRHLDFSFDFVEICGGVAETSKFMAQWGFSVMPPIELSDSPHFDLKETKLLHWLCGMLESKKLRSLMAEPVCTTFSPAAHPAVRSYNQPKGFNPADPKTSLGNLIAFRCLFLVWFASLQGAPAMLEQPRLSKMAWLSFWKFLLEHCGFVEAVAASCQFGSPHRKEFRLLLFGIDAEEVDCRCPGGHQHLRIQGKFTKPSATYVSELARHFAKAFARALRRKQHEEEESFRPDGIQSVVINDILMTGSWETVLVWFWRHASHINILESHGFLALLRKLALQGGDLRFCAFLDSRVAKGSISKGRSSARALLPSLRKSAALQVAFGLYPALGFAPTKLNVADDPTRDQPLRETDSLSFSERLSSSRLAQLHSVGLSAVAARWVRLVLIAILCRATTACASPSSKTGSDHFGFPHLPDRSCLLCSFSAVLTLFGFWISLASLIWNFPAASKLARVTISLPCQLILFIIVIFGKGTVSHELQPLPHALLILGCHGVLLNPENADERDRARRRAEVSLQSDRVLRPQTRSRREVLLCEFDSWIWQKEGVSLASILDVREVDAERVSELLVEYGKDLFYAGRSYGRFSETINAVGARKPLIRRSLVSAWDLAFSWVTDEPHTHHPAMPLSIVSAFSSLAHLWGWPVEAAIFLLTWCGLMRIGETLGATRSDLILPKDSAPGIDYVLVRIKQPKTRGSAARHQSARVDPVDVIDLLDAVFGNKAGHEKLWPMSPSTLRKRFAALQRALGLPIERSGTFRPYDLASLRAGGATFLMQRLEDAELVRRRGRWLSARVLEIYLQEISAATFQLRMQPKVFDLVQRLAASFSTINKRAIFLLRSNIPPAAWPHLW